MDYVRPYVMQCFNYERHGWHLLFHENPDKTQVPAIPHVDRLVAFLSDPESGAAMNLKDWFPNIPIHIFPPFPSMEDDTHVALYIARLLQKTGLPIDSGKAVEEAYQRPLLEGSREPSQAKRTVLHPGSGSSKKNYAPEFWMELIQVLDQACFNQKAPIVLLLGPAEEGFLPYFKENLNGLGVEVCFYPNHEDLVSLLSRASLYIGHDSGITHLAAMLGIRVMALFKESSIQQWHPLGPYVQVWRDEAGGIGLVGKIMDQVRPF
jgi:ADP-heptose:LPS heptosyltransferase